jgi:hypothetical protein
MTRAKIECITSTPEGRVEFMAVYSDDPNSENKAFWDATPCLSLVLHCLNPAVVFEPGAEYYLDFTKVEK